MTIKFDRPFILGLVLVAVGIGLGAVAKYQFGFGDLCMSPSTVGAVIGVAIASSLTNHLRSRQ